ncbi:CAP domain-containing protein [Asticcacaulis currens]|uniref:CAP domain-containing protein n=1 Tax=Asticcacaulis currens TaxID=2984210 RepID=UPI0034A13268
MDPVNLEREAKGCAPLVPNHRLDTAADDQAHSMAERNFFNHVHPTKPILRNV